MPSTTRRSTLQLWVRILAACALLAVVAGALVGAEALFFGVLTYGALVVFTTVAEAFVPDGPVALTLAVAAYAAVVYVVVATYHATRNGGELDVRPELLGYVQALLVVASLAVTFIVFEWLGLPRWVFGTVIVTLIVLVYPMTMYQAVDGWSADADDADEDDEPPWALTDPDEREPPSLVADLRTVAGLVRQSTDAALAWLGRGWAALAALGAVGGLAVTYVAASARSVDAVLLPVSGALVVLLVGFHLADVVRTELGTAAVMRELDGRFADESGVEGRFEDGSDGPDAEPLRARVDRLAAQAGIPAPTVRVVSSRSPTAAAVGYRPSSSTLVVSTGLVDALDGAELDAVLAHELAHVANRDAAVLTALSFPRVSAHRAFDRYGVNPVMAGFAALVALTGRFCVAVVARSREFAADDAAVAVTGDPGALASALETLDAAASRRPATDLRSAAAFSIVPPPWEEHPFFDRTRRLIYRGLLGTHPSTDERVERLRARARDLESS